MKKCALLLRLLFLVLGITFPTQGWGMDRVDLKVALKILPLLTQEIPNPATIAIVYTPKNNASHREAESLYKLIHDNPEAPGGIRLKGLLVTINDLRPLEQTTIALLTEGLTSFDLNAINEIAGRAKILTISTTIDYVRANRCVLGIVSRPGVRIYYSRAAAEAGKIEFSQAFTMLVSQI